MPHPVSSHSDSAYTLPEELIEKRQARGLQIVSGVMLAGLPMLMVLSLIQRSPISQLVILTVAFSVAAVAYGLLRRGHHARAGHVLVFSLIACAAGGIYAFGSTRSAVAVGFTAAVVTAGMTLGKKALVSAVGLSAAALAVLTWAETAGLLVTPDYTVGLRFWLLHALLLTGIGFSVYTSRQVVLRALHDQHAELLRRERAEHELGLSEDRFSRIFRSSPAAIMVQALEDMTVLDVNPAFERLYGYSREEFTGGSDEVLWDKPEARKAFQRQMAASGRVINLPLEARAKGGHLLHVLLSTEIEGQGKGRIVVTTITDVTAETQARQQARQSAELFSKAFDFSPINMTITRVRDGTFLAANASENRIQGYEAAELVGRTSVEMGVWRNDDERRDFVQELQASGRVLSREMQMRHKSGAMVDCRVWSVIVDIAGEPCMLNSVINISEQKRREAVLINVARGLSTDTGEAFFRSVVQHLGEAISADLVMVGEINPDRSITSVAMLRGDEPVGNLNYGLDGTPCDAVVASPDICSYADDVQHLFPADPMIAEGDFRAYMGAALRDADGTPIGVLNALWRAPQPESADRIALMQIFASRAAAELVRLRRDREITRLHETLEQRVNERTEQLMATNAELESFGYSVSHDLQSPLRSIEGFSVLLARRLKGRLSSEEERLFDRVRVNVVRMHELINDLLALARVSKGRLVLGPVDLSALMQQVVAQERQRDPQRQVQVSIQPGIHARCDSKFARIILENLVSNAWKYSRGQAQAHIEFGMLPGHEGGRQMLFVRDNGAGFNMAYSASLFKPFHRLHRENEFEGSGIGLATVHRILERHGGVIRGESDEGKGACFYFSFDPRFGQNSS